MMTITDNQAWTAVIGEFAACRERLANQDPGNWPRSVGGLAATSEEIRNIEKKLGYALDPDYKLFLGHVNGWPNFYSDISLLSLEQLGQGAAWTRAAQILLNFYEYPVPGDFPLIGELFPIGVSAFQNDVLAVIRTGKVTGIGSPVLWLANQEIERFDNMRSMMSFFLGQLESELENAQSGS